MGEEIPIPHKGGRPRGRFDPTIDWALAESLFVYGETIDGGAVTYPSFSQIAARAGTTKSNISNRAKRYNWPDLRLKAIDARGLPPPVPDGLSGVHASVDGKTSKTNPRARVRRSAEQVLDAYIDLFSEAVRKRKVRADAIGDFDKAVRLRAFVRGEADSRKATHTVISLEVLQRRYTETRGAIDTVGEEVTGVLTVGGAGSLDGDDGELEGASEAPRALAAAPVRQGWDVAAARVAASGQ